MNADFFSFFLVPFRYEIYEAPTIERRKMYPRDIDKIQIRFFFLVYILHKIK